MSGENPYMQLCNMLGSPAAAGLLLLYGTVQSFSPLTIDVSGITVTGDALLVNAELVSDLEGTAETEGSGTTMGTGTGSIAGTASVSVSGTTFHTCTEADPPSGVTGSCSASGSGGVIGTCQTVNSGTCQVETSGSCRIRRSLSPGDRVVLLTSDYQSFFLLARAVKA